MIKVPCLLRIYNKKEKRMLLLRKNKSKIYLLMRKNRRSLKQLIITMKMMIKKVGLIMMLLVLLHNNKLMKNMSKIKKKNNKINNKVMKIKQKISRKNKKKSKIKKAMRISPKNMMLFLMKTKNKKLFLRYKQLNQRLVKPTKDTDSNIWSISLSSWKINKTGHPLQTKALPLKLPRLLTLSKKIQKQLYHLKSKRTK